MPTAARRPPGALGRAVAYVIDREVAEQGLTQQALGDFVHLSQTQVSSYLRGAKGMSLDELYDICRALGLSITDVIAEAERLR